MRRILISVCSVALSAFVFSSAVTVRAYQAAGVAGTWKLNEAASNNPNGPAPAGAPAPRGGGAPKTGGAGDKFDATGGASRPGAGAQAASELSPEEKARINRMIGLMNKAAQTLEIVIDGSDCTIKQDNSGFPKQNCDGKNPKTPLVNPQIGKVDIKIKIDAKGMTREIATQEDLKIIENYTLSADGKQLIVTMKASQPVMKIEDAKIKRVYDRQ